MKFWRTSQAVAKRTQSTFARLARTQSIRRGVLLLCGTVGLVVFCRILLRDGAPRLPQDIKYTTSLRISIRERQGPPLGPIPRIIHQTFKTRKLGERQEALISTWKQYNPNWDYRFYDDEQCHNLVAQDFPEWLDAYNALPLPVERADFFRYLVVLRYGGVYADVDTECGSALDDVIQPDDTFLAGWEDEFESSDTAVSYKFARQRQVLQWSFAASPGHPVLQDVCEQIVSTAYGPLKDPRTDALFRTGPGPFTDVVLRHAMANPYSKPGGVHKIRVMPRIVFGGQPPGWHSVANFAEPHRALIHWFSGSWKSADFEESWTDGKTSRMRALELMQVPAIAELGELLFPVSTITKPSFAVMVHMMGHGDRKGGVDLASQMTKWGTLLAPGEFLLRRSPLEVFLDAWKQDRCAGKVLLDFGSGPGVFSLAAAANSRKAWAFDAASRSTDSFQASIAYNGFDKQIKVHTAPAMATKGCAPEDNYLCVNNYTAAVHAWTAQSGVLSSLDVGAVRISIPRWESFLIEKLMPIFRRKSTRVVVLELYPHKPLRDGTDRTTNQLVELMRGIGFVDVTHVGHVCVNLHARFGWQTKPWYCFAELMSRGLNDDELRKLANDESFCWCQYQESSFQKHVSKIPLEQPELLILKKA